MNAKQAYELAQERRKKLSSYDTLWEESIYDISDGAEEGHFSAYLNTEGFPEKTTNAVVKDLRKLKYEVELGQFGFTVSWNTGGKSK